MTTTSAAAMVEAGVSSSSHALAAVGEEAARVACGEKWKYTVFSDDFYIPALVGGCGARALKRVRLLITFAPPNYTAPRRAV